MTINGILQIVVVAGLLLLLVKPLGVYMAGVFSNERSILDRLLGPVESLVYRASGVDPQREQHWTAYTVALLLFNLCGMLLLYGLQRLQHVLPLNPQKFGSVSPDSAFNTAVSFTTNTNWQGYSGESTMSYLVQMAGLTVQNFVSAATGIAIAVAFIRAFARQSAQTVGNFWTDLVRCTFRVLLPLCLLVAPVLVWQGVPQNLRSYDPAATLEGGAQLIAQGPVASQEAIKHLGTNGGGFFNANAAHPFENPTPLTNLVALLSILVVGAALTHTFGRMVGDERQGWALLAAMMVLVFVGVGVTYWAEAGSTPVFQRAGVSVAATDGQSGGNMEGKEVRFGIANSAMFAVVTTDTSCGAVNSMHDSFTPLGGMVPLINIMLGEIVIGGVGAGLYGMLLFVILAIFISGLMVGRTPEYLGKKIEGREVKMTMLSVLILPASILGFTGLACVHPSGLKALLNAGPHGFTEMLYAFSSGTGNNGSAFAGLSATSVFYNLTLGLAMLIGRFAMIVPCMAVIGSLASKKRVPATAGTFPTHGPLFVGLLVGVIVIVGGLTFFPALSLGPIVEHLAMVSGKVF